MGARNDLRLLAASVTLLVGYATASMPSEFKNMNLKCKWFKHHLAPISFFCLTFLFLCLTNLHHISQTSLKAIYKLKSQNIEIISRPTNKQVFSVAILTPQLLLTFLAEKVNTGT